MKSWRQRSPIHYPHFPRTMGIASIHVRYSEHFRKRFIGSVIAARQESVGRNSGVKKKKYKRCKTDGISVSREYVPIEISTGPIFEQQHLTAPSGSYSQGIPLQVWIKPKNLLLDRIRRRRHAKQLRWEGPPHLSPERGNVTPLQIQKTRSLPRS